MKRLIYILLFVQFIASFIGAAISFYYGWLDACIYLTISGCVSSPIWCYLFFKKRLAWTEELKGYNPLLGF